MIKFVTVIPKHSAVACICMPNYTVAIINDEIYNSVRLLVYIIYILSCRMVYCDIPVAVRARCLYLTDGVARVYI